MMFRRQPFQPRPWKTTALLTLLCLTCNFGHALARQAMALDAQSQPEAVNGDHEARTHEPEEPPPDAVPAAPEDPPYRRLLLDAQGPVWLEPGQRGFIEAHPLLMGLAAMALATVTLLFFFLRGIKRPEDKER